MIKSLQESQAKILKNFWLIHLEGILLLKCVQKYYSYYWIICWKNFSWRFFKVILGLYRDQSNLQTLNLKKVGLSMDVSNCYWSKLQVVVEPRLSIIDYRDSFLMHQKRWIYYLFEIGFRVKFGFEQRIFVRVCISIIVSCSGRVRVWTIKCENPTTSTIYHKISNCGEINM